MIVQCYNPTDEPVGGVRWVWAYRVVEDPDGRLVWRWDPALECRRVTGPWPGVVPVRRTGGMTGFCVTAEEAEAVTGLAAPVAFDRLRELVHESGAGA